MSYGSGRRRAILWRAILPLLPFLLAGVAAVLWLFRHLDPLLLADWLGVFVLG